jgi:enterobactin synthetase component D
MLSISKSPRLFGPAVACASVTFAHADYTDATIFPFGVTIPTTMHQAAAKRRAEYVAGRVCAVQATRALLDNFRGQIEASAYGIPIWPE